MSFDAQAEPPDATVAKRIPSYMLPKKKPLAQKPTRQSTPENQLKSKVVKRNARIASKASRGSMGSTWSLEDAQVESKIEVTESIVSGPVYISSDADDIQSSVSLEDDVSEEKRMVAASKR
jgi:hypothetical protein